MLVIPAIDLKEGQCVRLRQGDMADSTVFSDDPVAMAQRWCAEGARRLHLVDLDGAFAGEPVNAGIIKSISRALPDLPIQIGGGIRNLDTIAAYLEAGVQYAIIGTMAARDPEFVLEACAQFPGHIIVGIDARKGRVAVEGWANESELEATDLASRFADAGVSAVVYTDIDRDGMMQGVNVQATVALAEASGLPVIASGGISQIDDVRGLMRFARSGICGAITGRAIYEGALDLAAAQAMVDAFLERD
ncbi:MAG: 1-(5-phosphoribosyl)-5-[(5-phosphoribosylamino)methylideneamino]imidazole-4-carboxamide isomerase [Luminiphilus sp.]|jgi:phosphoribosylformimino-5-aminoimidazole carboxamide ribotide isomerase|nr:1-(5-phosphoribosyl)-5-[(5-phosphoribosylamino)methylideneamino]imidazole-4-carboxamide isomerase [Luminiphilus sp.]